MNTFVKADSLAGVFDTFVIGSNTYYDVSHITSAAVGTIDNTSVVFIQANAGDAGKFIDSYQIQNGDTFIWTHGIIYSKPFGDGDRALSRDITPDVTVGFVEQGDTTVLRAGMTLQQCMEAIFIGEYKYLCGNFSANISVTQPTITLAVQKQVDTDTWEDVTSGDTVKIGTTIRYKATITASSAIAGPLYMGQNMYADILCNGYWKGSYTSSAIDTTSADYGPGTYSDNSKTTLNESGTEEITILSKTNAFSSATPQNIVADWVTGIVAQTNDLTFTYGGKTYTVTVNADTTIYAVSSKNMIYNTGDYYRTITNGTQMAINSPVANSVFTLFGESPSYYYWDALTSEASIIEDEVYTGFDSSDVPNFVEYTGPLPQTALTHVLYVLTPKDANKIILYDSLSGNQFANPNNYDVVKSNITDANGIQYNLFRYPKDVIGDDGGALYSFSISN